MKKFSSIISMEILLLKRLLNFSCSSKNPDLKEEFESFSGEPIPGFDEVLIIRKLLKEVP